MRTKSRADWVRGVRRVSLVPIVIKFIDTKDIKDYSKVKIVPHQGSHPSRNTITLYYENQIWFEATMDDVWGEEKSMMTCDEVLTLNWQAHALNILETEGPASLKYKLKGE